MQNFKTPVLTDREPLRLPDDAISAAGYLNITARIARTGIQTYYGYELAGVDGDVEPDRVYRVYRAADEVFASEALKSFTDLPVTLGHPAEEIGAANYRDHAIGHVIGTPERDGDFVRADLSIRDAGAIEKIQTGEATELSVGYHADVILETGHTADGQDYDAVQRQIRGNHIALVDQARCGAACRIGDAQITDCDCTKCQTKKTTPIKEQTMTDFVMLDGEQIPLAEAVDKLKNANARMAKALEEANSTIAAMTSDLETKTGEVEALKQTPMADSDFTSRVQARAKILAEARSVLGDGPELSGVADSDIRRRVINHIYGDGFASGASEHALMGMYKVAVRDAVRGADNLNGQVSPASTTSTHLKAALTRRNDRLQNAWKANAPNGGA